MNYSDVTRSYLSESDWLKINIASSIHKD